MKPGSLHDRIERALGILYGTTVNTLGVRHIASLGWTMDSKDRRTGLSLAVGRRLLYVARWRETPRG
ncbi:hypothetical protein [Kitasatospora sp. NPDC058046]|uniref:hypothetical protein n=1 Tax=Kitasatospora sp. NPDC058046 TaxID=3346312 RepID=UPI0036D7AE6E